MGSKTHFIKVIKCFVAGASVLQYNTCLVMMMMMMKIVLCETAFFFQCGTYSQKQILEPSITFKYTKGISKILYAFFFISLSEFIHVKHNQDTPSGSCWPDNPSAVRAHTELDHLAKR